MGIKIKIAESLKKMKNFKNLIILTLACFFQLLVLPATMVPAVIVKTDIVIPFDGRIFRKITPSKRLAIGTHRRMALYIGIFIPFRATRAIKYIFI